MYQNYYYFIFDQVDKRIISNSASVKKPGEQKGEGKGVFCRGFGGSRGGCTKAGERFWPPSLIFDDVMISDGALTGSIPVVMMIIILVLI